MSTYRILVGDCRETLRTLDAESVQTCVTSPPYFGLRDYGADGQIGLEPTPEAYVAEMVAVFREVRRVLRPDGTLWLNLGDSYASTTGVKTSHPQQSRNGKGVCGQRDLHPSASRSNISAYKDFAGLKPKDLIGIPWRVAFALQADGWVLRSDICWSKVNPMPESVRDRPTKSHEYVFMFAKARWSGGIKPAAISERDAIWLAVIVDGEGTICFQERRGGATPSISVRLSVVNTNRALLERVAEICNNGIDVGAPSPRTRSTGESGRSVYAWQVTNRKAAAIIAAIRPYLIAKRAQADLALIAAGLNRKHKGRGGHVTTPADLELKRKCAAACSDLNRGRDIDLSWMPAVPVGRWMSQPYYYDAEAIAEPAEMKPQRRLVAHTPRTGVPGQRDHKGQVPARSDVAADYPTRNARSVWSIATQPYPGAHFATFPPELAEKCILAGTSQKGACAECGAPWVRVVERAFDEERAAEIRLRRNVKHDASRGDRENHNLSGQELAALTTKRQLGWEPSCDCNAAVVPCVVLDPFGGSGTVGMVATGHGRNAILCELNPEYVHLIRERCGLMFEAA